jgi:hypothetical protein
MDRVRHISRFDRYQASLGLEQAAAVVAEAAVAAGLGEVTVDHFPADGGTQWWSFQAPVSWTPTRARLELVDEAGRATLVTDHRATPFALATYSAPTPVGGVLSHLIPVRSLAEIDRLPRGGLAVVDRSVFGEGSLLPRLVAAGAVGLVTDAAHRTNAGGPEDGAVGRIELTPHSTLTAFSLTPRQFSAVVRAADRGGRARLDVVVDRGAAMPVVSGVLPGEDAAEDEVWLIAHLCHPRPGANDNASGVAALLGVASTLSDLRRRGAVPGTRRGIRFFWGPEFVGSAAVLHQRLNKGRGGLPSALINLDMVGEDQALCRSPFVVERPPETVPSLLGPLAEHVVAEVFGATDEHPGDWHPSPFLGFSDHALFADPSIARPAVQFCHPADRFNHSGADSPDKVSPVEMLRSTAAGAVLAHLLAGEGLTRSELVGLTERWCERETAAVLAAAPAGCEWSAVLRRHVQRAGAVMRVLAQGGAVPEPEGSHHGGPALLGVWDGPLNLRAMLGELGAERRARLQTMIARDKGVLSVLFNLAIRADGRRSADGIAVDTACALRTPIDDAVTGELIGALMESGWVVEAG